MLNLQSLSYIVKVSAIGSINKAAEGLYISQPSLSRAIQEIENEIGIVIFERTSKGVITTHEGQVFIDRVRKILGELEELENNYTIGSSCKENEISLAIGIERHYPAIYAAIQFYNRYCTDTDKHVNLILREGNRQIITSLVYSGALSMGNVHFMSGDRADFEAEMDAKSLNYIVLSECPVCAQVSEDHPLAGEKSVTLDMLSPYPRVAFLDEDFTGINYVSDMMQYDRSQFMKRIVLQERGTHREVINNTQGYSIGAYYEINHDTDPDIKLPSVIRCIPIADIEAKFNTVMIYRSGHRFSRCENAYMDLLVNHYGRYFGSEIDR